MSAGKCNLSAALDKQGMASWGLARTSKLHYTRPLRTCTKGMTR